MVFFKYSLSMFFVLWLPVDAKSGYSIDLLNVTSSVDDVEFFKAVNVSVIDRKVANFDLLFGENVTEWSMKLSLDIPTKGKHRMNLIKTEVNVCQLLKSPSRNNFVATVIKEVLRTSNMPRMCPFIEHVVYSIRNYTLNDDSYPVLIPTALWQFDLNSILNKMYTFNITLIGRIRKL